MKPRFDMGELKKEHVDAMKARDKPFYGNRNADASWDDIDILDFYGEDSLLIRHFEDTEGKIIGFIGFAGRKRPISRKRSCKSFISCWARSLRKLRSGNIRKGK